jgi:nitroreductase
MDGRSGFVLFTVSTEESMPDFMEVIKGRRSIRNFQGKEVPGELLACVLEAVRWAPSWANTQCWEIVVVKDPAVKRKLQEIVSKGNPATRAIVEAPVVLGVCGRLKRAGHYKGEVTTKFGDWLLFDLGIATQNLCLAAHHCGLGTVIVGLFDHDAARKLLAIPDGFDLVALVPMGFPSKAAGAPKRREAAEFTHFDSF